MAWKRHGAEEIATKLAKAEELASAGKSQREIAQTLGISIMTYHRWRKLQESTPLPAPSVGLEVRAASEPRPEDDSRVIEENDRDLYLKKLEDENNALRRLVTDLLIEKLKMEDVARNRYTSSVKVRK